MSTKSRNSFTNKVPLARQRKRENHEHSLEVVKDFSLRHVEGETRNISKIWHISNIMAMFRCAQHDGKFVPQNLTTSKLFNAPLRVQSRANGSYSAKHYN